MERSDNKRKSSQVVYKGNIRNGSTALLSCKLDLRNNGTKALSRSAIEAAACVCMADGGADKRRRVVVSIILCASQKGGDLESVHIAVLRPDKRAPHTLHEAAARPSASVRVQAAQRRAIKGANGRAWREVKRARTGL
jgi:hypothetical protein